MPRTIPLLPFSDVAGKNIPCTRDGFPHYSIFVNAILPTLQGDGLHIRPNVLKLRGGKRFELYVQKSEIFFPAFEEHFRFICIANLVDSYGKPIQISSIEVEMFTGDAGRRVCYVKFPEQV